MKRVQLETLQGKETVQGVVFSHKEILQKRCSGRKKE